MKRTGISIVIALCAVGGCKKKQTEKQAEPAPTTPTTPAPKPVEPAPPVAAGSGSAIDSKDTIAGSQSKSPTAVLKLDLPSSWDRIDNDDGGRLETVIGVNDSKYPVDNAQFTFEYGPAADNAPTDPSKYGEWHSLEMKTKVDKTGKIGDATYYAFFGPRDAKADDKYWSVVKKVGDKLWTCGGSLYKGGDMEKIPKERDKVIAEAKKICASMN